MATYKLIQDIEAEDKILGPLTLRQFIFALISVFFLYLCFFAVTKHVLFLLVLFLPPALFFGFFALPFGRDQPTEVWFLAKLRFWFKPRRRTWNQSGVKELVTITVPKKVERVLTNGLSQTEVKSRLQALAQTIDTRGWATKNVNAGTYAQPSMVVADSDRLIDIGSMPQEVPSDEVVASSDDMLDAANNPIARQFDSMITQSSQAHRQQLMDELNDIRTDEAAKQVAAPVASTWFTGQGQGAATFSSPVAASAAAPSVSRDTPDEAALSDSLAARAGSRQVPFGNLRTMQPLASQAGTISSGVPANPAGSGVVSDSQATNDSQTPAVTPPGDPAILSLAKNNDLNVATLAREAQKNRGDENQASDEVVISLH